MLDFSEPGEMSVFLDEGTIEGLEKKVAKRGFLEGSEMAGTFNMLRANDLIWSFVVNNYLMGKDPFPFDLLYWNSDSTRMPAAMHSFYLRNMYLGNKLKEPGGITLGGVKIDISKVKTPVLLHLHHRRPTSPRGRAPTWAPACRPARPVRPRRLRPHRRHRQSAGRQQFGYWTDDGPTASCGNPG